MRSIIPKDQKSRVIANIIVIAAGLGMLGIVINFGEIFGFLCKVLGLLAPFMVGIAVAFLLSPLMKVLEKFFSRTLFRKAPHPKATRVLSMLLCYAVLLSLLYAFARIVIPQLILSMQAILNFVSTFINANSEKIAALLDRFEIFDVENQELIITWEKLYAQLKDYFSFLFDNVITLSKGLYSFLLQFLMGLISSIYMLADKERFAAQCKKLCYAIFSPKRCADLIHWVRHANHVFIGYISGSILDSLVVGVLCYLGMLILRLQFPLLISVIVGVTNIIPFFGPFIGAVPGVLILLIIDPISAVWFALFIMVLQQIDGNIISPFILGDSVGVSPFWIMVSIVVGGGLFGIAGMILAVPVFALLYAIMATFFNTRLSAKNLPTDSAGYDAAPECFSAENPAQEDCKK